MKFLHLASAAALLLVNSACTIIEVEQVADDDGGADTTADTGKLGNAAHLPIYEGGIIPISDEIVAGDPAWAVESWTRLPVNMPAPTLANLAGKVVVILCFQHW